jgi:AhpD family alkylhydroperoxidase
MSNCVMLQADDREKTLTLVPPPWQRLAERYPAVVAAYDALRAACNEAGPLDESTVALIKLAVSVGAGVERTVHMHSKKALRAGVHPEALRQIVLVALPTIGLPAALDALRWVDESIEDARVERARVEPDRESCSATTVA